MNTGEINFFNEGTAYLLRDKTKIRKWLHICAKREKYRIGDLNYIFTSDTKLRKINREYLDHDYFTDVITFDNSENRKVISGDIFISIDRIRENARTYGSRISEELHRVMVHGLLHLTGYDDKTPKAAEKMRKLEDKYLNIRLL